MRLPTITVIIPTFNEAGCIVESLGAVRAQGPDEVVVVDGGSADATLELVQAHARVFRSEAGRAVQMNQGAREATGDILLFLHADTRLPERGLDQVRDIVARGAIGGRFTVRFDDPHWLMRVYAWLTRFHVLSMGDQAFFVRRDSFLDMGGYRSDVPFEDIDFYRRLRKRTNPCILQTTVLTSARRFQQNGRVRQQLINILLVAWHYCGGDVRWLKDRLYPPVR